MIICAAIKDNKTGAVLAAFGMGISMKLCMTQALPEGARES